MLQKSAFLSAPLGVPRLIQIDETMQTIQKQALKLMAGGVTINRPPREGRMAFVRTPDNISIELLQDGHLEPQEPWASMANTGSW